MRRSLPGEDRSFEKVVRWRRALAGESRWLAKVVVATVGIALKLVEKVESIDFGAAPIQEVSEFSIAGHAPVRGSSRPCPSHVPASVAWLSHLFRSEGRHKDILLVLSRPTGGTTMATHTPTERLSELCMLKTNPRRVAHSHMVSGRGAVQIALLSLLFRSEGPCTGTVLVPGAYLVREDCIANPLVARCGRCRAG